MKKQNKLGLEQLETRTLLAADFAALFGGRPLDTYSVNGTDNNLANPDWGSAGSQLLRLAAADYADGVAAPAGADRPSPREISNALSDQSGNDIISDRSLSAMIYAWGQFIDHDLDLTPGGDLAEAFPIAVPAGDASFDPLGTGTQSIPLARSAFDPDTGIDQPREQVNVVTSWLDGSMIYGSDAATAAALRTMVGGKLKTSSGEMLPYNSTEYMPTGTVTMANDAHLVSDEELYATGDVRGNENVELTALHTLFMREHNGWADRIAAANRSLTDEQIYQRARSLVIAEIQSITFNEWLPALLGRSEISRYDGYDPSVNPNISNEFSTAAFRLGHSMLGDDVEFLDNRGVAIADEIPLSEAFFNPAVVSQHGIDSILKYLASDPSSEVDLLVVDSVRNFLFGPPGAGGLDLVSLNIQRGRDHGLADYNSVRVAYGLPAVTSFDQITSDPELQAKLATLYGSVDNLDLWPAALAEDHVAGASVGPTLRTIIADQFERLRDGDRFWYQNVYEGRLLRQIENTGLSDILSRNTQLSNLQDNAFLFRASISGSVFADSDRDGRLDRNERALAGQEVQLLDATSGEIVATTTTDARGRYRFDVEAGLRTGRYQIAVLVASDSSRGAAAPMASRTISITRGDQFVQDVNLGVVPSRRGRTRANAVADTAAAGGPGMDTAAVDVALTDLFKSTAMTGKPGQRSAGARR